MSSQVPTMEELYHLFCADMNSNTYNIVSKLLRDGINTFDDLHRVCKKSPCLVCNIKGVGPKTAEAVCSICRKYAGVSEDECSNDNFYAGPDTLLGMKQRGQIDASVYNALSRYYTTIQEVREQCGGDSDKFSDICAGLGARGMQKVCSSCEAHTTGCLYVSERAHLNAEEIPNVYINNVMRAFGVTRDIALWALAHGTPYK